MHCALVGAGAACVALILGGQSRSYRVELSNGASGRVMVVNDSDLPMEAFHLQGECGNVGDEFSDDELDFWGVGGALRGPDGRYFRSPYLLESHQKGVTIHMLAAQPSSCSWRAKIDAVVYVDGSYEGDELEVRGLQAHRDGLSAAVQYWVERLGRESAPTPDIKGAMAEAEKLKQRDVMRWRGCGKAPLACQYWWGRYQVDGIIGLELKAQPNEDDVGVWRRVSAKVVSWRRKIEADGAFQKLDVAFPLPGGIAPGPGEE
jgi:hypothetical protein